MTSAIGQRITLRAEGPGSGTEAEIGTVGAVIAGLRVDGVELTEPIPERGWSRMYNGVHLAPWPNRVRDGRWSHDGEALKLDLTEPERGNALHGLVAFTDFEVRERTDDAVRLGAFVAPQHGWPFALELEVEFRAVADGLRVTHAVMNRSATRAPYATSAHPYLRIGDQVDTLRVTVPAERRIVVDERLNPTGVEPVEGTRFDLRGGPAFGDLDLDTAYEGLAPVNGAVGWIEAPDGARLELLADADWRYAQVFTTRIFPRGDQFVAALAMEPMTAPPDALNTGEALVWLEPGERWSGSWGLRYTPAD